ncbi:MAG: hypothetical protein ACLPYZ_10260 [Limisphaerales bacterium]
MIEDWNKQCTLDRKLLQDIHLAVCGNKEYGVNGLVEDVKQHGEDIESLKKTRAEGLVIGKASSVIIGLLVSISFIGCFFVAVYEALKNK